MRYQMLQSDPLLMLQPDPLLVRMDRQGVDTNPRIRFTHMHVAAVPFADACAHGEAEGVPGARGGEAGGVSGCCSFVWDISTFKDSNVCRPASYLFHHCAYALSPVRVRDECLHATQAALTVAGDGADGRLGWRPAAGGGGGTIDGAALAAAIALGGAQLTTLVLPAGVALPRLRGVGVAELAAAVANATGVAADMDSCGDYCRRGISRKGACEPHGPSLTCARALGALAREALLERAPG
ncbi:hypothetical protein T492DRAFT_1152456 [Pavlovales sp. CCMP2436]|nr:hypothetical protein T492DRAFT_1152456 [Pavlovales sp. CCMP2436]